MVPLIEVLNGQILAEPGTRFKREAEKIKENIFLDSELEQAQEELKLQRLTDEIKTDVV